MLISNKGKSGGSQFTMSTKCTCHVNGFMHWGYRHLHNSYDLGFKLWFDQNSGEPGLTLFISVKEILGENILNRGSISVTMSRTEWANRRGISAVQATNELQAAEQDLDSEVVRFLHEVAEKQIQHWLEAYERTGILD